MDPVPIARELRREVSKLRFADPVTHVYNPLDYAREPHEKYLRTWAKDSCEALLIGMNPGPFGMAQTGVPFGEVNLVRDWIGITGRVTRPKHEHPKRPIEGFECTRSEISGQRLWGWAKERFGTPDAFFARFFVWNYCPLVFMEATGRNRTPDKLQPDEKKALFKICDHALNRMVMHLRPRVVVGVGRFARDRAERALDPERTTIGQILHPSPASPAANRGWAPQAEEGLRKLGIEI